MSHKKIHSIPEGIPMPEGGLYRSEHKQKTYFYEADRDTEMVDLDLTSENTKPEDLSQSTRSAKVEAVEKQISEIKDIMIDNIHKVTDRGVKLDDLVTGTDVLAEDARKFRDRTTTLKRKIWRQNFKLCCIIFVIVAIIIAAILVPIILRIKNII
jgi:hypothetical protein